MLVMKYIYSSCTYRIGERRVVRNVYRSGAHSFLVRRHEVKTLFGKLVRNWVYNTKRDI
jgi:hypothetical protein